MPEPSSAQAAGDGFDDLRRWLLTMGFSPDDIAEAERRGELDTLAADGLMRPGARYTAAEAMALAGVEQATLEQVRRAAGLPPPGADAVYTEGDIALFRLFAVSSTLFSAPEVLHFTRVLGSSLARLAEAANSLFLIDVEVPHVAEGGSVADLSRKSAQALALLDEVVLVMDAMFRLQMELATARSRASRRGHGDGLAHLAVGFIDLVGFTSWSAAADDAELDALVREFERQAYDLTADHDARVVKLMGDEVMFVAVDPADACAAGLDLVEAFTTAGATPRGGIAYGGMLARGGDYYGPVVNLASRLADQAVPGELLVTPELASAVPGLAFEPAGRRLLKGFGEPLTLLSLVGGAGRPRPR